MKFLADEGVDRQIVERLRENGLSVLYVAEIEPGISDDEVLNQANRETALLLTTDKDFGELVFRQGRVIQGVILIRLAGLSPTYKRNYVFCNTGTCRGATTSFHGHHAGSRAHKAATLKKLVRHPDPTAGFRTCGRFF
ncbi:MAG: DUF5615 family PIN-like protein [Anaerolineae bacterium]